VVGKPVDNSHNAVEVVVVVVMVVVSDKYIYTLTVTKKKAIKFEAVRRARGVY